ncbi:structural maintenance of chromosomes protein 5 [Ischnura elegans]|uniref:structural maintenance of chromosomes protein 5 n=1 Tax=Ischnura elegans TaxID=197161 RepID=UPI001ED8BA12|nr:structural maintenance of chromosomes protein 5 [Ischnura elegans]
MDGSIVRLYLRDFVTFHEITLLPNNHLNLITGPNGSGKSSIMCALCLGLAGKPKVVGRASSVSEYIRYNADQATIEIELYNTKGKNYVVSRTIFRDNKSSWSIGGYACSQKEVENLASKLNIQIDNLCQFLPQDRVQDFAKMNSLTLMENTEKCIGGMEMWEKHMQLKKLGVAYMENEKILHTKMEHLSNEEQIFAGLQSAMDKMTSKKALVSKVEALKQKRAHLVYEAANNDLKMAEEMLKKKTASVNKIVEESKPMEAALGNAKRQLKACEDKLKLANSQYEKHHQSIGGAFESLEAIHAKCKENEGDFERMLAGEKRRVERIKELQLQIEFMANLLESINEQELREKEAKLAAEEKQVTREIYSQQMEKQSIENKMLNTEHQIKMINQELAKASDNSMKLQVLKTRGLYEPIMWFRKNKDKLRGRAYEPMAMVISMKEASMAKYLECVVPQRDLLAFVCEDPEDANFLMEELRDKMKYKVNVVASKPDVSMSSFARPYELQSIRKYGFYTYLSDIFSAPEAVMRYLFKNYFIHRIPIGTQDTYAMADQVPAEIRVFMTDQKKFSKRSSRYTKEAISSSYQIGDAHLLKGSVNESSIRECTARLSQLKEELQELKNVFSGHESHIEKLEGVLAGIRKRRSENKAQLSKATTTKSRLMMLQRNEEEARAVECREEDLRRNLVEANQACTSQIRSTLVGKTLGKFKGFESLIDMIRLVQLNVHKARNDVSVIEHDLSASTKKLKEAEKEERACREIFEAAKKQMLNHLKQLEELCKLRYKSKEFQNLLEKFSEYPDTLEEIDQEIHVTQTKAELIGHSDSNVIMEYDRRKKTIEGIKKVLDQMNADKKKHVEEIEAVKSCWLPFVNDLIKRVDKTFGNLLSRINYVGEVILVQGQNEFDFGNYGFKIQVKFRQEGGLQELNQFRQSGGERAVAIAVYLMSLQELTSVPFRCVDEINQGMDEYHEASVFRLLSDIVSKAGAAQYFLFTPKVLRTLTFTDNLLFTCVINGEVDNITLDCGKIAKIKKARQMKSGSK